MRLPWCWYVGKWFGLLFFFLYTLLAWWDRNVLILFAILVLELWYYLLNPQAVQNPDELFSHPELTAVCDIGWPDCFNSGMFVFVPSQETYSKLLHQSETTGSFDGGDQGILNTFFPNWNRVSFVFNMVASATYTYLPAYKQWVWKEYVTVYFGGG